MFLQIEDLAFQYKQAAGKTFDGISATIHKGEIISIVGKSGCGKSTLLRLIAGLEQPLQGSIKINGKTIVNGAQFVPPEKRGVSMVFQDYALFPHMTVAQNIQYGLKRIKHMNPKIRVKEMVELTGLTELEKRYPYELSGGQQQRVALARALAPEPSILLLDEPFSNLDTELRVKIREELKSILKQTDITSIFVTHDLEEARSLADRVLYIEDGKIANEEVQS